MRIELNLSRKPFTNHRLFWVGITGIFFISLWLGLWTSAERTRLRNEADALEQQIKMQEAEVKRLNDETAKQSQQVTQTVISEKEAIELAAARILVINKSFSWNRILSDIEGYVPEQARILSISVGDVAQAGGLVASIEVKALGKTAAQMTEMMTSLERSNGLFTVGQFNQDAPIESGEVPFTLILQYSPNRGGA